MFLFGVDCSSYWSLFDAVDIVAARGCSPGRLGS